MSNVNIYEGGLVCILVFVSRICNSMSSEDFVVDLWMKRSRVNLTLNLASPLHEGASLWYPKRTAIKRVIVLRDLKVCF